MRSGLFLAAILPLLGSQVTAQVPLEIVVNLTGSTLGFQGIVSSSKPLEAKKIPNVQFKKFDPSEWDSKNKPGVFHPLDDKMPMIDNNQCILLKPYKKDNDEYDSFPLGFMGIFYLNQIAKHNDFFGTPNEKEDFQYDDKGIKKYDSLHFMGFTLSSPIYIKFYYKTDKKIKIAFLFPVESKS